MKMDWGNAQTLIAPALTVLFQALKKIVVIGEDNQYIPIAAVVLGAVVTILFTLASGIEGTAEIAEATLRGAVFGAAAVGLYELFK